MTTTKAFTIMDNVLSDMEVKANTFSLFIGDDEEIVRDIAESIKKHLTRYLEEVNMVIELLAKGEEE